VTAPPGRAGWTLGLGLVLATAVVSGISTFVNSYAVGGTNSDGFVTVRNLAVAAMLVPMAVLSARFRPSAPPLRSQDWLRLAVIGVVGGSVPFLLFFRGLELATAAGGATTASFFYRTLFLFATAFSVVFLRERLHAGLVAGAALLLGGCYLLLSMTSVVWTDGSLYVLAATVLWAGEYTVSKRALADLPSSTVALGRMGIGGAVLAGYLTLSAQWGSVAGFSGLEWGWVAVSALLLTAFVATWYTGLARVDLGVATSVLVLGYPVTWLLAVTVRGAAIAEGPLLGVLAIVAGIAAVLVVDRYRAAAGRAQGLAVGPPGSGA
jgi:drug/metabolite transporter (DMT)-like permease